MTTMLHKYKDPRKYFFGVHKGGAKARGIPFELTFDEWWELWEPYWDQRGRGQDDYVMGRFGDVGPYAIGNVSIITGRENRKQRKLPTGTSHFRYKELPEDKIREDYATGIYSWNKLATKYNVSKRTIGRIIHNQH